MSHHRPAPTSSTPLLSRNNASRPSSAVSVSRGTSNAQTIGTPAERVARVLAQRARGDRARGARSIVNDHQENRDAFVIHAPAGAFASPRQPPSRARATDRATNSTDDTQRGSFASPRETPQRAVTPAQQFASPRTRSTRAQPTRGAGSRAPQSRQGNQSNQNPSIPRTRSDPTLRRRRPRLSILTPERKPDTPAPEASPLLTVRVQSSAPPRRRRFNFEDHETKDNSHTTPVLTDRNRRRDSLIRSISGHYDSPEQKNVLDRILEQDDRETKVLCSRVAKKVASKLSKIKPNDYNLSREPKKNPQNALFIWVEYIGDLYRKSADNVHPEKLRFAKEISYIVFHNPSWKSNEHTPPETATEAISNYLYKNLKALHSQHGERLLEHFNEYSRQEQFLSTPNPTRRRRLERNATSVSRRDLAIQAGQKFFQNLQSTLDPKDRPSVHGLLQHYLEENTSRKKHLPSLTKKIEVSALKRFIQYLQRQKLDGILLTTNDIKFVISALFFDCLFIYLFATSNEDVVAHIMANNIAHHILPSKDFIEDHYLQIILAITQTLSLVGSYAVRPFLGHTFFKPEPKGYMDSLREITVRRGTDFAGEAAFRILCAACIGFFQFSIDDVENPILRIKTIFEILGYTLMACYLLLGLKIVLNREFADPHRNQPIRQWFRKLGFRCRRDIRGLRLRRGDSTNEALTCRETLRQIFHTALPRNRLGCRETFESLIATVRPDRRVQPSINAGAHTPTPMRYGSTRGATVISIQASPEDTTISDPAAGTGLEQSGSGSGIEV